MFKIGDKVFYPMHGAGIIEAIEEKEVLGNKQLYYIMNLPHKNMQVMLPKEQLSSQGIRRVVDRDIMEDVLSTLHRGETDLTINHIQRHRINMSKIKSGDIYEGAEVIRDLVFLSKTKNLGTEDRNLLNNAQQILISELVLVKELALDQAVNLLDQVINS